MTDQDHLPLPGISRRTVIRSAAAGAAFLGAGGLSACAAGGGGEETDPGTGSGEGGGEEKTGDNPFGVDKSKPLDVVIFNGGYGDQYGAEHVKMYNSWAGAEVATMTSTVKIASTLQPRFAGGNPPDVIDNSGADQMPTAQLVSQNQIADLQPFLEAPTVDDPTVKVADVLLPGAVEKGSFDGTFRQMGYVFSMWGLWYSSTLFEDKGWQPAKDWNSFMDLCDQIKSSGLAPFVHTGVHTQYMATIIATMGAKHGGKEIVLKVDNLAPDAWANDSMLASAKSWSDFAKAGYIFKGSEGIDHTTSQTEWLLGNAAMIPVGSWVENEMQGKVPEDFNMVVTPTPSITASDALPFETINGGAGEPFIIAERGKNPAGGMEYLRQMISQAGAAKFAELTGSLAAVKGAGDALKDPSTALQSVADAADAAGDNIISFNYAEWYSPLNDGQKDIVRQLMGGKINADQFCAQMQKLSDSVAADPKITKYKRESA